MKLESRYPCAQCSSSRSNPARSPASAALTNCSRISRHLVGGQLVRHLVGGASTESATAPPPPSSPPGAARPSPPTSAASTPCAPSARAAGRCARVRPLVHEVDDPPPPGLVFGRVHPRASRRDPARRGNAHHLGHHQRRRRRAPCCRCSRGGSRWACRRSPSTCPSPRRSRDSSARGRAAGTAGTSAGFAAPASRLRCASTWLANHASTSRTNSGSRRRRLS